MSERGGDLHGCNWMSFGFYGAKILFFAMGHIPIFPLLYRYYAAIFVLDLGDFWVATVLIDPLFLVLPQSDFWPFLLDLSSQARPRFDFFGLSVIFRARNWTSSSCLFFTQQESACGSRRRFPARVMQQGVPLPARSICTLAFCSPIWLCPLAFPVHVRAWAR
jgi:hypothetical protein